MPVTRWSSAAGTPRRSSASRRHSRESDGWRKRFRRIGREAAIGVLAVRADEPVRADEHLADEVGPLERRVGDPGALPSPAAGRPPASTSSVGPHDGILGEEPGAGLLEAAQRLVERGPERPVDGHDLAGRLHLRPEAPVGAGELVERETRQLDDDVVERRLERRHGRLA